MRNYIIYMRKNNKNTIYLLYGAENANITTITTPEQTFPDV